MPLSSTNDAENSSTAPITRPRHDRHDRRRLGQERQRQEDRAEREGDHAAGHAGRRGEIDRRRRGVDPRCAEQARHDAARAVGDHAPADLAHVRSHPVGIVGALVRRDDADGLECRGDTGDGERHYQREIERPADVIDRRDVEHRGVDDALEIVRGKLAEGDRRQVADRHAESAQNILSPPLAQTLNAISVASVTAATR